ncbi:MAG TPA: hypothetical protein VFC19_32335 [Candidatus Limnocylindrales bacterium]|nr:hypothetical protein [Candidatus Limnocylindrales bacterium]
MPSIASLFVVAVADLPSIVAAGSDGLLEALEGYGREIEDAYFWSGDNLLVMVQHLWRSKGISLFSVAHQRLERSLNGDSASAAVLIIGAEHKELLPKLDPSTHDLASLTAGLVAWGVPPTEARIAVRDGLALLHHQIAALPDGSVLVIHVA